jgi:ribosome-binding protein aMBF1 (putative translation factor)
MTDDERFHGELMLPERIRRARVERGLSLRELAAAIGVQARTLSDFEWGRLRPADDDLRRLDAVLETSFLAERHEARWG